jgi:peptide/nickel transport system permease protein
LIYSKRLVRLFFFISLGIIILIGLAALAAPIVSPYSPTDQNLEERYGRPGENGHLLGTDNFGRDVLSRIIHGSRSALLVGIVSVSIAAMMGLFFGLIAGLNEGWLSETIMLLTDSVLSFPTILLAIAVVTFFGYGLTQVMVAIGIIFSPVFTRIVRAETLSIKTEGYIESSRALGSRPVKTVFLHFLPNMAAKIVVQCAITFALSVVIEASLSYLGLGAQPPNASWGLMLKDARNYLFIAPWLAIFPGAAVALTVLSFNILGDTLVDMLNTR